jgi:GT2 family glycosyltransferase
MLKLLAKHFDCVDLVRNPENFGFGPANNIGAEQYGMVSDVLVFTQTDVRFHGDPIPLIQEAKQGELYGARLLDGDTGWNTFGTVTVSYLEGWFLSCTKETWDRLGGFDPRYVPADFEDVDLCYNSVHKGVVLVEKPFPVSHNNMGASGWQQFQVKGMNREAVTIRNRELFAAKWSL